MTDMNETDHNQTNMADAAIDELELHTPDASQSNERFTETANTLKNISNEIGKAVIGQQQIINEVLVAFIAAGHVLIEGVPGLGKTLLVRALAKCFGGSFSRVQFTPDLMPTDITGHAIYDMKTERFKIRKGPIFANLILADEINRAPAKTQSALLEVMQEKQVTIEGKGFDVDLPYMVLATQNPIEQEGTYPLPEAELDRFIMKIHIDFPSLEEEQALVSSVSTGKVGDQLDVSQVATILSAAQVLSIQQMASEVVVDEAVLKYAVKLVRTTREWAGISKGAGPRGSIALVRAGRAQAILNGNDFVTPDDIKRIAPAVLRHRIGLSAEMEIEGVSTEEILADILNSVEAPRQ